MSRTHLPVAHVDYEPMQRKLSHVLEPGMIVRPRRPDSTKLDEQRWTVESVRGAYTRAKTATGASQNWATDTLVPVKFKRTKATAADRIVKGAESRPRRVPGEEDTIAAALKAAAGLDALLDVARSMGFPDSECDRVREKVSHLNPGLQRMNVGNRLRAWLSKNPGRG